MSNQHLDNLNCSYNQIISIPSLNNALHTLCCSNNNLTCLPPLNGNNVFGYLNCVNNNIVSLPQLPTHTNIQCENNPIYDIICDDVYKNNKWNHFLYFYFLSKLKKKFLSWMWKSREERIKEHYHPKHLLDYIRNFDDNEDLDEFLRIW